MNNQNPFRWRHYEAEILVLCVRWYLRYAFSHLDLEEMMRERGSYVDHTTIYHGVQCYAPELDKRCRPHLKACNDSWKVDEPYINVKKEMGVPLPLKAAGLIPESCELRQVKYLNNLVEQDHRFIKRLTKPSMGFFSFETAWRTLQGYEIMNVIRKGQLQGVEKGDIRGQIALVAKLFGRVA
ncbi:MAG: hypothetical protein NVSMB49_16230 [Ktedonobacteraceae bacterium]